METHHRHFDDELSLLKQKLLRMGLLAESMIDASVTALVDRNEARAANVPSQEQDVNRLQLEIDEHALCLMATHQPVANDLRFLAMSMRINSDIERIADLAVNITENTSALLKQPPIKPLIDIPRMAQIAGKMVRDSLNAFIQSDAALAQSVILTDDQVDDLKDQIFRELLTYMLTEPRNIERAIALILVSRHLERIGDHATNIAEDVIFMVQGRDVRHPRITKVP